MSRTVIRPNPESLRPPDVVSRVLLGAALVWSAGLMVAAFTVPAYSSAQVASACVGRCVGAGGGSVSTVVTHSSHTLAATDGGGALLAVALPLVATLVVASSIEVRRRAARSGAGPTAWTCVAVLAVLAVLGVLSIGAFVVPVAVLAAVSCGRASAGQPVPPDPT